MREVKKVKSTGNETPDPLSETGNELGTIKIHENVIASIVRKATLDVEGVARLAGSTIVDNLAEIVGSSKMHGRSIRVDVDGPTVEVEIKVNIAYGAHVPTVAGNIQRSVIDEVGKSTGMTVTKVDVVIQEIEEARPEDTKKEESDKG